MIHWKRFGRKRSWANFKVLPRHSPGGTEENHENLSRDSRSPGRHLNPGPHEYEAGNHTITTFVSVLKRMDLVS
jgi:hypothetical protein